MGHRVSKGSVPGALQVLVDQLLTLACSGPVHVQWRAHTEGSCRVVAEPESCLLDPRDMTGSLLSLPARFRAQVPSPREQGLGCMVSSGS